MCEDLNELGRHIENISEKNLGDLLITALLSAKKAGDAVLDVYQSAFDVELKDDKSPLTAADNRSHEIITTGLVDAATNFSANRLPVLSEEGKDIPYDERKLWDYFWIVDPLDGTKEFVKRNGEFTVNIALIHGEQPVLGVIHAPVSAVFFFAARGIGSYRLGGASVLDPFVNDQRTGVGGIVDDIIEVKKLESILAGAMRLKSDHKERSSQITVVGSRSHSSGDLDGFLSGLKRSYERVDLVSAGSSLKFCMVAEGIADLYVRHGPTMEWDTAAGQVIVEEAGGTVENLSTAKPLKYNKENLVNPPFIARGAAVKGCIDSKS